MRRTCLNRGTDSMRSASTAARESKSGIGPDKDGYGTDRKAYVAVGVLGLEEPRIQHRQLLHRIHCLPSTNVAGGA